MKCDRCHGSGIDPTWKSVCCNRATSECGGLGCTGPEPEEQQCSDCNGGGELPDMDEPPNVDVRGDTHEGAVQRYLS